MPDAKPPAATVEDYDSDADEAIGTSPLQKHPRPVPRPPPPPTARPKATVDAASDSGYSSRTAATRASADSANSPPQPAALPRSRHAAPNPAAKSTRSFLGGLKKTLLPESRSTSKQATKSALNSASRPIPKPASKSTPRPTLKTTARRIPDDQSKFCSDPHCKDCTTAQQPRPLESPWGNVHYPQIVSNSSQPRYSSPARQLQPPQLPPAYEASSATLVAAPPPRTRTAGPRPRPQSYHPGVAPDGYWIPVGPPAMYEHGPPPAPSAYSNSFFSSASAYPYPYSFAASSPTVYHAPPSPFTEQPTMALTHHPRPALPQRATDTYMGRPRPSSMYDTPPLASYAPNGYATTLVRTASVGARRSGSSTPYDAHYAPDSDRQMMPPPPRPNEAHRQQSSQRRRDSSSRGRADDKYRRSEGGDSSSSDPDGAVRLNPAHVGRKATDTAYEQTKADAKDYMKSTQSRRRSYASHEQHRSSERRASVGSDAYHTDQPRYARPVSRPTRVDESQPLGPVDDLKSGHQSASTSASQSRSRTSASRDGSNVSKVGIDGFKIEVDKQGMNLNVNGQRISVMPKEGGLAELIIGGRKQQAVYADDNRSQHSSSRRRSSKSSKSSSNASTTPAVESRTSHRPTRRRTVATTNDN